MKVPSNLKYSSTDEWVLVEGNTATIGITDYAQNGLGIISALELPEVGDDLEQDDSFGSVEARKTVAEIYAPLSGPVLEVNKELPDAPALINDDPYDDGWLVQVEIITPEELVSLMSAEDYREYVEEND